MSAFAAEVHKLVTHPPQRWLALAGVVLPWILTWFNASGARADLAAGRADRVTEDLGIIGSGEPLLAAAAVVLRNGLVPLVYLVGNSTVLSPGYLLTQRFDWAWYLPDTAPMSLLREPPDPGQPATEVGAAVGLAWVAGAAVAARREP